LDKQFEELTMPHSSEPRRVFVSDDEARVEFSHDPEAEARRARETETYHQQVRRTVANLLRKQEGR
jgi:hypothetical protein